ncbi:MAG: UDP-3-O-(3-hydroxymyristoyl)glucosamine N-acyltransferase, partial [Phycisphaerae bacterium]
SNVSTIDDAGGEDVTWVVDSKNARRLVASRAAAVIVSEAIKDTPMPAIVVADPEAAVADVLAHFERPQARPEAGVHQTAVVAGDARLGKSVAIGPHVTVGSGAWIGDRTKLHAGVYLGDGARVGADCELWPSVFVSDRSRLGDRVVIKPGSVIGSDGFGFIYRDNRHRRIPQIGIVVIEDDVDVGANVCIDRAKCGETTIGRGTKIDNLVQVAHNCRVGPNSILVAQVGLSGSVRLGAGVLMAGASGAIPGVTIGDGARVGAVSVATKDLASGGDYWGTPAQPSRKQFRDLAAVRRIADLITKVRQLSQRVAELERTMHDREAH